MSISQAEIAKGIALEKKGRHAAELAMQGKWDEAVAVNREIVSDHPDNVDALNRLGKSLLETGLIKDAINTFRNALNLSPNNPIAIKNLHKLTNFPEFFVFFIDLFCLKTYIRTILI